MSKLHIKLDIQRFAADMSISCSTVSQSTANNTSTVRVTVRIYRKSGSTNWSKPYYRTLTIRCDGQSATHSTELPSSKSEVYYSSDFTVTHNADGTKYIEYSASLAATSSLPALSASGSTWLTTIPRYTSTTNWSIASRTETSITLNWATANTCSQIRYGTSTSSYTTIDVNSSSGQVTISGLSANTPYNLYFMPRRSDSGLWGNGSDNNWSSLSNQYTHDYPKAEEITAFTIGTTKTNVIKLNNPLNRQVTIILNLSNNNTYTLYTGTGNGYISAEFFTAEATTALYNSIPSSRSGIYSCSVYCSATSTTKISGTNTYSIKNDGTENPTFDASNWSYVADLTALTHNDQVVINGQSTLTFTVNTAAQAKYGASIKEYRFKWGNASKSSTLGYTVSQGNGNILTVEAIDTRDLSTVTTKTLSSGVTYLPYLLPNLEYNFCNTHRTDGITSEVKLNLYGTLSLTKFGETGENNSISSASYRVYDYDISDWTQYFPITTTEFTYSNNVFRLEDYIIHANGSSGGFTVGKHYLVQVQLKDGNNLLGTFTSQSLQITDGKLARDVFQDINGNYHQGINGLANDNYAETIHGDINVVGNYHQNGQPLKMPTINNSYSNAGDEVYSCDYVNKKTSRNIAEAYYSSNITLTNEWNYPNFNSCYVLGDKLEFKNGKIYVKAGVSKVRVSATCFLENMGVDHISYIFFFIQKNGGGVCDSIISGSSGYYESLDCTDKIVFVNEGDYFNLNFNNPWYTNGNYPVVRAGNENTRLFVEVIE